MLACAYNLRKCGVSTCANVVHMATKYEWTAFDHASQMAVARIIKSSGYSYRTMSDKMNNVVSHVRISDIEKGKKAPIKLSEFLLICQACQIDPVATLRQIIDEARRLESRERESRITDDLIERIAAHPEDYDVAANRDPNARLEAETPDE